MNDIDITLYLNEYCVRALADTLGSQTAETVEDKLTEAFDTLYQEYVPDEQRASIEARIEREDAAEQARLEAARRFAVYHIRENGDDCHFTSDYFHTSMQAAYRYRLYERGELSSASKTFADAFIETNPVSLEYFGKEIADLGAKNHIIARLHTSGALTAVEYAMQTSEIGNRLTELRIERRQKLTEDEDDQRLAVIKDLNGILEEYEPTAEFNNGLFDEIIESITVDSSEKLTFQLLGDIALTEQILKKGRCKTA